MEAFHVVKSRTVELILIEFYILSICTTSESARIVAPCVTVSNILFLRQTLLSCHLIHVLGSTALTITNSREVELCSRIPRKTFPQK
jgi:hypothetical protein